MSVRLVGIVIDATTGESLPGANVYTMAGNVVRTGVATDANGTWSHDFEPGEMVRVSFVGYTGETFEAPAAPPAAPIISEMEPGLTLPEFEVIAPDPSAKRSGWGWWLALAAAAAAYASDKWKS